MPHLTSPDGTTIAYDRIGDGPPIILVDGAMCYRGAGPWTPLRSCSLTPSRCSRTTGAVVARAPTRCRTRWSARSRICSALIDEAGGEAYVYAISSGVALALAAAAAGARIGRLALYEPPFLAGLEELRAGRGVLGAPQRAARGR